MNLRHKLCDNLTVTLFLSVSLIFLGVFYYSQEIKKDSQVENFTPQTLKTIGFEKLSLDGLNKIISYGIDFNSSFYDNYYNEYFDNNIIISVKDMETRRENYLFTGNRIGYPHWLGNGHIFFTSYCGTSCQGIYLVDIFNKETRLGVLSYMDQKENKNIYTNFQDWFDHDFNFNGWVNKMKSEIIDDKIYLIFEMQDLDGKPIGVKRFLFTGNTLKE